VVFFKAQAFSVNEGPNRTITHLHAPLRQVLLQTAQGQLGLLGKAGMNKVAMGRQ
jgi:hypothetical protein